MAQVDETKASNAALTSDLESIRLLFNEKEKELSLAVNRVEELTNQLEELRLIRRQQRGGQQHSSNNNNAGSKRAASHALQLEALRRELTYRQQVTSQQASRVAQQRMLLSQKQEEMTRVDRRIAELQQRLHRRRMFNDGLMHQLSAQQQQTNGVAAKTKPAAKIAAVEPFRDDLAAPSTTGNNDGVGSMNKNDPKYQTLPYNTKFAPSKLAAAKQQQSTDAKVAPVPPPKPTTTSASGPSVIASTTRTYTSVYSAEETSHHGLHHHHHYQHHHLLSNEGPASDGEGHRHYSPKTGSIPPRLSPAKPPESVRSVFFPKYGWNSRACYKVHRFSY